MTIDCISAITLATHDMSRAVWFYQTLGFEVIYGSEEASFTSFRVGKGYLNLIAQPADRQWSWWGRVIFHVSDVDALYQHAVACELDPDIPGESRDGQEGRGGTGRQLQ